uniref:Uncharacterized protein n=1 Tax=Angiostrongylus cantonensis TaxID=6313 RepID=A0A0K0DB21_ANGCA
MPREFGALVLSTTVQGSQPLLQNLPVMSLPTDLPHMRDLEPVRRPMEAAWIKNYGDDLYLQRTYTCIRVLDRGLAHASKNDKRCGTTPASRTFVVYPTTSNDDEEEVEVFRMGLEKFYREDHTFFNVILEDLNTNIGPRRSFEKRHIGTYGLE